MPLSQPAERELTHTRVVTCHGYRRADGLFDIEGRIVDTKPYRFRNRDRGGWIEADEALHDMSIRLTVDVHFEVVDAEAVIDASPYNYCTSVAAVAKNLVGLRIRPGWTDKSRQAMGDKRGCTHLTELLGPVATTAIQTIVADRNRNSKPGPKRGKPPFLNSCHSYADDSPVIQQHWPEAYRGE